jgi:acyl-CoA thioester hydrolase
MRWSDMDAYQHVNNVAFLGYFEMARISLFRERPPQDDESGRRRGLIVAAHEIAYKRQVVFSSTPLQVDVWITDVRAATFLCRYELFDHDRLAVTGSTTIVPFDFDIGRPRRLTPEEKEFLARWADEPPRPPA